MEVQLWLVYQNNLSGEAEGSQANHEGLLNSSSKA